MSFLSTRGLSCRCSRESSDLASPDHADLTREHRIVLLTALAEQEPQTALSWLRDEGRNDDDASGSIELYRSVMPALLRDDLNAAESLIADLGRNAPLDLIQQVAVEHAPFERVRARC